jgi:hypothetical protein
LGGGIIGTVIALTTSNERAGYAWSEAGAYVTPVVVAVVVLARLAITLARDHEQEAAAVRQTKLAAQRAREDAATRAVVEREHLHRALRETAQSAVARFEQLPVHLRTAPRKRPAQERCSTSPATPRSGKLWRNHWPR